jgi:hypothetical protein
MSRRDAVHEVVKELLIRAGWVITDDPYSFNTEPELATDLGAERTIAANRVNEEIAVEIKSFRGASQVSELERAIGQYMLYRLFLEDQEPGRTLYLAVPTHAYEGVLATEVGRVAIERLQLNLLVFPLSGGEDLLWIKSPFSNDV